MNYSIPKIEIETARLQRHKQEKAKAPIEVGDVPGFDNDNQKAIHHGEKALEIARIQGHKQEEANALLRLGSALKIDNQIHKALQEYKNALKIACTQGYTLEETKGCLGVGDAYIINNQIQASIKYHKQALDIAKKHGHRLEETIVNLGLGYAYLLDNQIQKAIQCYKQALENARKHGHKLQETKAYLGLGEVYRCDNQNEMAIQQYEKALEIAGTAGYKLEETQAFFVLGEACRLNNQIQTSIQYYQKALESAIAQGYELEKTQTYLGLGDAYRIENQIQTSIQCYQKAGKTAIAQGYKLEETQTHLGLGEAFRIDKQIQTAIQHCEIALEIATQQRYKLEETKAYLGLGCAYKLNKNLLMATEHYEKALRIAREREYKGLIKIATEELSKTAETNVKGEETHEDEDEHEIWFTDTFLDSKHKLKEEVHKELRRFSWLSGAYGLTAATKKIRRPHIYLTVKRGMKKSDVRRDLENKFKCDAKLYFELLQEPKQKPKIKYLGKCSSTLRHKWVTSSSLRPTPGGGVLACIRNFNSDNSNPLRVPEKSERRDLPVEQGTGTITMFCACNNEHYALTCFHVCCATDETHLNATLNKKEDIQAIRSSLPTYVKHAKEQQYYFAEKVAENNNDLISFGDDGRRYTLLGDFHKHHFDNKCDIMCLKVPRNTKIECKMTDVASPNWDNIREELFKRVYRHDTVNVEKTGFSSDVSYGQLLPCDFSYKQGTELLFQDAYVIKGYGGPFLKGGDSGSPVFFQDKNDKKQIFAYGDCEMDELPIINRLESTGLSLHENAQQATTSVIEDNDDGDSDNSSTFSEEESDDSEVEFQTESEITGRYFICLGLDTALENLGLHEATCVSECNLKRSETHGQ